jgi:membrane dipeptidase
MRSGAIMSLTGVAGVGLVIGALAFSAPAGGGNGGELRTAAKKLARSLLIADTHIDLPSRLIRRWENLTVRGARGEFDYIRAREGGLDLAFMSIYVPSRLEGSAGAAARADSQIALVRRMADTWPGAFVVVTSTAAVESERGKGRVMLAMGLENGAPINGNLDAVRRYRDAGIRYITLAHAKWNHLADASYDKERKWKGLSPFGREVVAEMNRLGVMVDVSHLSDSAMYDVLRVSKAPVIASHSSCRSFTPGYERNMDDEGIRALAASGGVIQISFGSSFLRNDIRLEEEHREPVKTRKRSGSAGKKKHRYASVRDVADHIDHVVQLVGIDHVGFGSDFEGVGDSLPTGLKNVADYPNLLEELLRRGYAAHDIGKICSGNLLRVWRETEETARALGGYSQ